MDNFDCDSIGINGAVFLSFLFSLNCSYSFFFALLRLLWLPPKMGNSLLPNDDILLPYVFCSLENELSTLISLLIFGMPPP